MSQQEKLQSSIETLKADIEAISVMAKDTNQKYTALETEKDENKVEKELLILQIQQLQEELEEYYLQAQQYKSELDDVNLKTDTELKIANTKIRELSARPAYHQQSGTLKLMQLSDKFNQVSDLKSNAA